MRIFKIMIVGILALSLGAFSQTTASAAQNIQIAFLVPLTGGGAFYGSIMRDMGKKIVAEINKEGIKGFGKIKVRVYDSASDPAVAARKMERAVAEGANVIWGGFSSSVEKVMVQKADELKIPYIINNATSYAAFPNSIRYTVNPTCGSFQWGQLTAKYFLKEGVKTYAIIGADYLWGRTWDKSLTLNLKGTGIKKVYEDWHDFSKVDFSADIAKLKKIKPDAVVRTYGGAGEYAIIKQMKEAGYWPKVYVGDTVDGGYQVLLDNVGEKYALGVSAPTTQNPEKPKWIAFAKSHKAKFGVWPTWLSDGVHDSFYIIKLAIEKAGSLDPAKVAKAMHEVSYDGVTGYTCGPFQKFGQLKKATAYMIKWVKGSPKWTDKLHVHRKLVCQIEVKPLSKEGVDALIKSVK